MTFNKYNITNNAICQLDLPVTNTSNLFVLKGNYDRLPTSNFILKVTEYSGTTVIGRENILFSLRSGNIATVSQRAIEPVPIDDNASENIQQALSFSADSVCELVVSAEVITDIQNEVENKLNTDGGLRTGLDPNTIYFSDNSGNETAVTIGASGKVLTSNGPTETPSFEAPTVSITALTEDTTGDITSDFFVKNNGTGLNTKIKLTKYNASDAEALAGVNTSKYVNPKQIRKTITETVTTMNSTITNTVGTVNSSSLQMTDNYLAIFTSSISVAGLSASTKIQYSSDNSTWIDICTESANNASGSGIDTKISSVTVPLLNGYYYRTQSISTNNTNTSASIVLSHWIRF